MTDPMTADRPTTVAEAVEAGARALWTLVHPDIEGKHLAECWPMHIRDSTAVLSAVGYADLIEASRWLDMQVTAIAAERDALAATVVRVEALVTGSFDPERSDVTVAAIRAALHWGADHE